MEVKLIGSVQEGERSAFARGLRTSDLEPLRRGDRRFLLGSPGFPRSRGRRQPMSRAGSLRFAYVHIMLREWIATPCWIPGGGVQYRA